MLSLSARRAWIEIAPTGPRPFLGIVALRKESVDRNLGFVHVLEGSIVALRKESVDRNFSAGTKVPLSKRRSPQGERG